MGSQYSMPVEVDPAEANGTGTIYTFNHEILSQDQTRDLIRRAQRRTQDPTDAAEALGLLVEHNARLVLKIADIQRGRGVELADLIQAGMMGLLRAVEKFDLDRTGPNGAPIAFSTVAVNWIRQAVERAVCNTATTIRNPVHVAETRRKIRRAAAILVQTLGRDPSPEEIAQAMGVSADVVRRNLLAPDSALSLDKPVAAAREGRPTTLADLLAADGPPVEAGAEKRDRREMVLELLSQLDPRSRRLLELRYGLLPGEEPRTLEAAGAAFGITRERARQVEADALRLLREIAETREARAYIGEDGLVLELDRRNTARELAGLLASIRGGA